MKYIVFILSGLLFLSSVRSSHALSPTPTPVEVIPVSDSGVDYMLPYPGLLPNHPLYPLKVLRDKILDIFLPEGMKKIEFHLLMGDKRLAMGEQLMESQDETLAISTVLKGEKYMERAITEFERLRAANPLGTEIVLDRFAHSVLKHKEVISVLRAKVTENQKQWQEIADLSAKNVVRVGKIQ